MSIPGLPGSGTRAPHPYPALPARPKCSVRVWCLGVGEIRSRVLCTGVNGTRHLELGLP